MINNLPKKFLDKLNQIYNKTELETIFKGFQVIKRKVTFRVNTLKSTNKEIEDYLNSVGFLFKKLDYLDNGYILLEKQEKDLWDLDLFKDGKIYLQGITSQFIGQILTLDLKEFKNKELKVLDLTASPGGKITHIGALTKDEKELYANDLTSIRIDKIKYLTNKLGFENINIIKNDARKLKDVFPKNSFDIIIADLPCSAEGRINLNKEKSYFYLNNKDVNKKNYKLQKEILENNIELLKEGGILIYSTCTLDPLENEGIVHFLLSNNKDLILEDISSFFDYKDLENIKKTGIKSYSKYIFQKDITKTIRLLPSENTEGFFIAKFRKI
ncbi:RsmB/NOP family class I SAM-dependent RNA methyltransferase [Candidatus Gracilibacteria bacterium]|nr:RsmB/NOP family class I SAM-dependent RNA methyltransferase [Candidatus Gracilibacteria bacterium]